MRPDVSEEDAIRLVLSEGGCADFVDVANLVKQRFGHHVGAARVEQVVHAMNQETPEQSDRKLKQVDIGFTAGTTHAEKGEAAKKPALPDDTGAETVTTEEEVLRFVEQMGGFQAAKKAIADLESSLRKLM